MFIGGTAPQQVKKALVKARRLLEKNNQT